MLTDPYPILKSDSFVDWAEYRIAMTTRISKFRHLCGYDDISVEGIVAKYSKESFTLYQIIHG